MGIFQPVLGAARGPAAPAESLSLPINHSAAALTMIMFECLVLQPSGGCGMVFASALCAAVAATCGKQGRVHKSAERHVFMEIRRAAVFIRRRETRVGGPGPFLSVPHLSCASGSRKRRRLQAQRPKRREK